MTAILSYLKFLSDGRVADAGSGSGEDARDGICRGPCSEGGSLLRTAWPMTASMVWDNASAGSVTRKDTGSTGCLPMALVFVTAMLQGMGYLGGANEKVRTASTAGGATTT